MFHNRALCEALESHLNVCACAFLGVHTSPFLPLHTVSQAYNSIWSCSPALGPRVLGSASDSYSFCEDPWDVRPNSVCLDLADPPRHHSPHSPRSTYLSVLQIFTEGLLFAADCARHWGTGGKQKESLLFCC